MSTTRGFRSLADQLRSWTDERLSTLLSERPDLATPAPHDFGQLASRAAVRTSVVRALDTLTRLELCVLDALVVSGQTTPAELGSTVHAAPGAVEAAIERLRGLALVWDSTSGLRPLTGVAEALTGGPEAGVSGLRPRSAEPLTPAQVKEGLAELSAPARALLDHVLEQGGEATTSAARHTLLPSEAATPAEELLSRRLLVPRGTGTVVLPGEVGLALRGGRTTTEPVDQIPALSTTQREPALVDRVAGGAAFELVRRLELLLDHWGTHPPPALRSGGLGVRELKAAANFLHVDERAAALLVETASTAGLLASRADADGNLVWVPTDVFDTWTAQDVPARWASVARSWLESPRMPGLVGSRDAAGKPWNVLTPELAARTMPESRAMTLRVLAELPPGAVLAAGTGLPSLVARLAWLRPRRPRSRAEQVAWAVEEAAALGLTGLGGLASYARVLLDGGDPHDTMAALLPEPVDHVLIQADLTAVAPGPLESSLARRLQLVADVESRGGATTYRFTPASVRRALDLGWTAAEVHEFLGTVSRTPVPQPLTYLVDDTVRTFGAIRVGQAESFLRSDDEAALTELLHDPKAGALGLRRLAPTVIVSDTPIEVLLPRLRDLGAAPVVEAADGTVRVTRPDQLRARIPRGRRAATATAHEAARIAATITAVRSGDRAAASRPASGSTLSPSGSLAALREAIEAGGSVLIGYVDNHGTATDRIVDPLSVEGGQLTARDHRADDVRTFAVHRITNVKSLDSRS
ncbi:helicase C-terminal domain-containing protein [Nocardioides sp. cx-169]|uniref:helicase-associated domain-containing protein n=1 Tax=Nocardioides sp. cx-169 TaxID=2899080 RepID=UPI001E635EE8|nr:helicase C-terminal domain-containing protein [Nocardioides sp. cx-169]MCD4536170.1 helicase C-terminal domain-containing protein [Nocardioides sp. cx-169]